MARTSDYRWSNDAVADLGENVRVNSTAGIATDNAPTGSAGSYLAAQRSHTGDFGEMSEMTNLKTFVTSLAVAYRG